MRFVSAFIILILSIHGQVYAQERDTLVEIKAIDKSGLKSFYSFPFRNNMTGFYGRSVWDFYGESYGMRTYEVNNKLYFGTAGYSDKSFNEYSLKSGIYRQTNYSSSLFVGYRFSEKFSISAGFTIQRNNDPLNRNQPMQNGGIFP